MVISPPRLKMLLFPIQKWPPPTVQFVAVFEDHYISTFSLRANFRDKIYTFDFYSIRKNLEDYGNPLVDNFGRTFFAVKFVFCSFLVWKELKKSIRLNDLVV